MATARYTRIDTKRPSSNYCSTVTVVVFVALCLVGVWMMTSSSSDISTTNIDVPQEKQKTEVKQDVVKDNNESPAPQFEDNPGDLPEDATKGDSNVKSPTEEKGNNESSNETQSEEKQEEQSKEVEESKSDETNKSESNDEVKEKNLGIQERRWTRGYKDGWRWE